MKTLTSRPAAAPYAEAAEAALPAEGSAIAVAPSSFARETAQPSPRALNEPVGFLPSSFRSRPASPSASPARRAGTSGVMPSPSEIMLAGSRTGSTSW